MPNPLGQAQAAFYSRLAKRNATMSKPSDSPSQQYAEDPMVFDEVVVGIFRSSHEGKYIYANRRLAELYGYDSPATLIEAIGDI
ncbi:MAG: PAS domain-containing protein, partial [Limisphaerales bacterium]